MFTYRAGCPPTLEACVFTSIAVFAIFLWGQRLQFLD
jgi:hypothetical protein